jgi:hypothetical protein
MSKFDRNKVRQIHKDISDALKQIATKHGMHSLSTGTLSFDETKFTVRVTGVAGLSAFSGTDTPISVPTISSPMTLMNQKFMSTSGKMFTVCDYKPANRKYPIIAKNDTGTKYKFTMDQVTRGLIK